MRWESEQQDRSYKIILLASFDGYKTCEFGNFARIKEDERDNCGRL